MGYGQKAVYNTSTTAFVQHTTVVDESFHNVHTEDTEKIWDCPQLHNVLDFGYKGEHWGHVIVYGGAYLECIVKFITM